MSSEEREKRRRQPWLCFQLDEKKEEGKEDSHVWVDLIEVATIVNGCTVKSYLLCAAFLTNITHTHIGVKTDWIRADIALPVS